MRALALLLVAACSAGGTKAAPVETKLSPAVVDDLAVLATGRRLPAAERDRVLAAATSGGLEAQVQRLLDTPEFTNTIAPRMMLGYLNTAAFSFELPALKTTTIDGVVVHYRRQACTAMGDVADVAPWWAMRTTIKICKSDYHPELLRDSQGRYCHGAAGMALGKECGCGPNLIFCAASLEHRQQIHASLRQETLDTIGYIVSHDLPIADVFTTRYSYRDARAAWTHYRDQMVNGALTQFPDLTDWPAEGKWEERPEVWPGQQAGIMTDIQLAYFSDGPRDRMRFFYERAWCMPPTSFGVKVERFRALVGNAQDLRYHQARWKQLAEAEGCTTCHARLDYGMQYFLGYQDFMTAMGPTAGTQKGTEEGPLYASDIDDLRGKDKLTPQAFGKLLVSQPEFADCMVQHVVDQVFGGATSLAHVDALQAEFKRTGTLRGLMTKALVLYARDVNAPPPVASGKLVELLGEHCQDCHQQGPLNFLADLSKPIDKHRLLSMLRYTAFELMPRGAHRLSPTDRREMVSEMIDGLDFDPQQKADATAYFLDGFRGSRTHFIDASRDSVAGSVGYHKSEPWPWLVESQIEGKEVNLTPSAIMQLAQTAMEACRAKPAAEREQCLTRALEPKNYVLP
jgi:hypothetical protein